MTLRDLYKKHHWQASGPNFYSIHLLFDKHFGEQAVLVDLLASGCKRSGAFPSPWRRMSPNDSHSAGSQGPRRHRKQIDRLLQAHEAILLEAWRWPVIPLLMATWERMTSSSRMSFVPTSYSCGSSSSTSNKIPLPMNRMLSAAAPMIHRRGAREQGGFRFHHGRIFMFGRFLKGNETMVRKSCALARWRSWLSVFSQTAYNCRRSPVPKAIKSTARSAAAREGSRWFRPQHVRRWDSDRPGRELSRMVGRLPRFRHARAAEQSGVHRLMPPRSRP